MFTDLLNLGKRSRCTLNHKIRVYHVPVISKWEKGVSLSASLSALLFHLVASPSLIYMSPLCLGDMTTRFLRHLMASEQDYMQSVMTV